MPPFLLQDVELAPIHGGGEALTGLSNSIWKNCDATHDWFGSADDSPLKNPAVVPINLLLVSPVRPLGG
jgi:hypothetical protein